MTETVALFCGITDASNVGGIHGLSHEGEDIEAFTAPFEQIFEEVGAGKHNDAKIMIATMWLAGKRDEFRKRFANR